MAQRFLAVRPRSAREVGRRLARAGFDAAAVEATLGRLRELRLLDDAEFARYWVDQRQTFRPRGAHVVRGELRRLGVAADDVHAAVEGLGAHAEDDAYRAVARRAGQWRDLDDRIFASRITQYLARRGFDWETIAATVRRLSQDRSE